MKDNRQQQREKPDDKFCYLCGHWFPKGDTRHYCPLMSAEIEIKDPN